jgi:hypothetical protein
MVSQREREKNRRIFPSRFFFEFFSFSLSLGFKTLKMNPKNPKPQTPEKEWGRKKEFLALK